ncbi:winged helix-turn-helix transcriptional regulator [Spongisporangium articulatum]|uniref:Winged helix-turn-helix transcriptional regulator n=1 Tax=Spongisporangium articulatum TaxID=3362603 RepID=A0ABW8AKP0_9ACTN
MSDAWNANLGALAELPVAPRPCSAAAALSVVGERWALLAVREIAYGVTRFDRIVGFTGAPRDVLTDRLKKLVAAGVVEKRQYSERPPRFEYHLTDAGRDLFPVLLTLQQWGDKWVVDRPALAYRHDCGEALDVVSTCRACGRAAAPESLTPIPG